MATETLWTFLGRGSPAWQQFLSSGPTSSNAALWPQRLYGLLGTGSPAWQQLLSSGPTSSNATLWPQRLYGLLGTGSPAWPQLLSSVAYPSLEEVCVDVLDIVTSRGLALTPLQSCFLLACAWPWDLWILDGYIHLLKGCHSVMPL